MVFFDTNIFVYAVSAAEEDQDKRRIARVLLADEEFALSLQVVQEFINTCSNKVRLGQSREAIAKTVEFLLAYPCLGSSHGRRNFLSVKVFRMDLEADFKRLMVVGFGCL